MGIELSHRPNFKSMKDRMFKGILQEVRDVVTEVREDIIANSVNKGVDYQGRPFEGYSPRYQRWKSKRTESVAKPNLFLTGHMMGGIQVDAYQEGRKYIGRIYAISNVVASRIKGNNKTRKFFAISKKSRKDFKERLINFIGGNLK
ncbi:MAG: hypothetical protein E6Q97_21460 [Desulfurellales bacterium]|nr:MAG: hypothetical protein E6Q97_21460 [Desulfurellales bacterium]